MSKVGKPITPSKMSKSKDANSSTGSKKKQLSLMSFFKPAPKPIAKIEAVSSPLKSKNETQDLSSDQELESSVIHDEETKLTDTPLTSESEATTQETKVDRHNLPKSSPYQPINSNKDVEEHSSPLKRRNQRSVSYAESDDEDDVITKSSKKRRKVVESDDDDEEDDFVPPEEDDDDDDMSDFIVEDDKLEAEVEDEEEEEEEEKPKKRKSPPKSKPVPSSSTSSTSLGNKFKSGSSYSASTTTTTTTSVPVVKKSSSPAKKNFTKENEERYHWLVDIKDSAKRPKDHPDYDPRTLYIPQSAWSKFTAFEKQYWEIKSQMWTTVVFFKKGKFYELYENDAMIANKEFDLKIAGGGRANMKLAGIPEMSFEYWAKEFISHGYKVAKVDQKETLLAKEMRNGSGGTKEEKIIKRELTSILTGGTLTDLNMINDDMSIYCMSIKEVALDDVNRVFGVAFVDTSTGELNLIEINDDKECTKLETLVTQIKPKEIICEKGNLSSMATKILKYLGQNHNQIWNSMNPISEFWDYEITVENLVKSKYYEAADLDDYSNFPPILVDFMHNHKVSFNAFGGLLSYLKVLKLDTSIMTLQNIVHYNISKSTTSNLILDGITLNNLEILSNSYDGGDKGTLLKLMNRAITPFGKRTLKHWILHPLMKINDINQRYDSVDYLMNDGLELRSVLEQGFTGLPDLERLLSRVHAKTLRFKDFLKVIEGFEKISSIISQVDGFANEESGSLHKYIKNFPLDLKALVAEWEDAFDREAAKSDIVVPVAGIDAEFDESNGKIQALEAQLEQHLRDYKKTFKSNEIVFRDSGKEIFLIEFPNKLEKKVPHNWHQMGSTSKVKRYWSPEVKALVKELLEQKELHKMVCDTLRARMYDRFDKHYDVWMQTLKSISSIDCLLALTRTSESIGYPSCRPEFVESDQGLIDFKELRHPCFTGAKDFIPNDVSLGGSNANFGLLTGANAAGKSTIMRTTALSVILSQLGCYIPAREAKLSPIDRIMTRLGANDNIMQGKSTFFVELSETKKILSNATTKSLVILDELGRGGSSSDGYAIAESVLYHLSTHVQPLGFFATHYGTLGAAFKNHPQIKPLRMGILIDNNSRNITFLYKLEEGAAPGSFGMNVASMCGISEDIVSKAEVAAKEYEQTSKLLKSKDTDTMNLGLKSDFSWFVNGKIGELNKDVLDYSEHVRESALKNIFGMIEG